MLLAGAICLRSVPADGAPAGAAPLAGLRRQLRAEGMPFGCEKVTLMANKNDRFTVLTPKYRSCVVCVIATSRFLDERHRCRVSLLRERRFIFGGGPLTFIFHLPRPAVFSECGLLKGAEPSMFGTLPVVWQPILFSQLTLCRPSPRLTTCSRDVQRARCWGWSGWGRGSSDVPR